MLLPQQIVQINSSHSVSSRLHSESVAGEGTACVALLHVRVAGTSFMLIHKCVTVGGRQESACAWRWQCNEYQSVGDGSAAEMNIQGKRIQP